MFEEVRGNVNNMDRTNFKRSAFGPQHFKAGFANDPSNGGIVTYAQEAYFGMADATAFGSMTGSDLSTSDILGSNWVAINDLTISYATSGSDNPIPAGTIVVYFNLRLRLWGSQPADDWGGMFAPTYNINGGGETVVERCIGGVRPFEPNPYWNTVSHRQEQPLSQWYLIDTSAYKDGITSLVLNVKCTRIKANSSTSLGSSAFQLAEGRHAFISFI